MRRRALGRAAEDEAYRKLRTELLAEYASCQAELALRRAGVVTQCTGRATEIHHRRKRSSAGGIAIRENCVPTCNWCNTIGIENFPKQAHVAGLVLRPGDDQWEQMSVRLWRKAQFG